MIRNLKVLGLALVAVFAFSAAAASAASAQQGHLTSTGPVTLDGTEIGEGNNGLGAFGLTVECPGSTYTGHKYNVTPHQFIEPGATDVTITPEYKNSTCHAGALPATVDFQGCSYDVHLGETTEVGDTYGVTYDTRCEVTVTIWFSEAEHKEGKEACVVHIPAQNGLKGGHATDETNGHIRLDGTVGGIHATKTKDNLHPLLCPAATTETATFKTDITVTGTNELGTSTEVSLSHS